MIRCHFERRLLLGLSMLGVACIECAGCGPHDAGSIVTTPVERSAGVRVLDSLGTLEVPVSGLLVTGIQLDPLASAVVAPTDTSGLAHFTFGEGRWAVSTILPVGGGRLRVAGSTGRVAGSIPGAPDSVMFRLQLAPESIATGRIRLAGRTDHSGTSVSVLELPTRGICDATGAWTIRALPVGVWTGLATQPGFRTAVFDVVVPAAGQTIVTPDILLQPGGAPAVPR